MIDISVMIGGPSEDQGVDPIWDLFCEYQTGFHACIAVSDMYTEGRFQVSYIRNMHVLSASH